MPITVNSLGEAATCIALHVTFHKYRKFKIIVWIYLFIFELVFRSIVSYLHRPWTSHFNASNPELFRLVVYITPCVMWWCHDCTMPRGITIRGWTVPFLSSFRFQRSDDLDGGETKESALGFYGFFIFNQFRSSTSCLWVVSNIEHLKKKIDGELVESKNMFKFCFIYLKI